MVSLNRFLTICLFFLLQSPLANAADLSAEQVAEQLQKTYKSASTFSADFAQITTMTGLSQQKRHGEGTLVVKRPRHIRWDYHLPSRQVLISDGRNLFFYLAAEKQMIKTLAEPYLKEDISYTFLTGAGDILGDFKVSLVKKSIVSGQNYQLMLGPKELHPQIQSVKLWVDRKSFMIKRLQMFDHLGTITDIALYNIKVNEAVNNDFFSFTPPPDTEIIEQ